MRKLAIAGAAACAVALSAQVAAAQTGSCSINSTGPTPLSCVVTSTTTLTLPSLLTINMSGFTGAGTAMTLAAPTTMADYTAATIFMPTTGPSFTVSANRAYKVQISAGGATFTGGAYLKPAGDLLWSNTNGSGYVALSQTPADMVAAGTPTTASAPVTVYYSTKYSLANDIPGTYSIDVKFTLVAP